MITFETQKDFEKAVMQVIIDNIRLDVRAKGHPFMTGVSVSLCNINSDTLLEASDYVG